MTIFKNSPYTGLLKKKNKVKGIARLAPSTPIEMGVNPGVAVKFYRKNYRSGNAMFLRVAPLEDHDFFSGRTYITYTYKVIGSRRRGVSKLFQTIKLTLILISE